MRVGVLDYGSGNIHSVSQALSRLVGQVVVSSDAIELARVDALVVPGVGAFAACLDQLRAFGVDTFISDWIAAGRKTLGICVGHQIMFTEGDEHGMLAAGLGILPGRVERLHSARLPHMGWNSVEFPSLPLFSGLADQRFYFVHSYAVHTLDGFEQDIATAWCEHGGDRFIAAVVRGALTTTQFHPEKSGMAGISLLRNWLIS